MSGTLQPTTPYSSPVLPSSPQQAAELQQRQQARETRLGQEGAPQVENLSQKEVGELQGFYNKVTDHIDQVRYPEALKNQSFIKDGSDPELLGLIHQVLERAPELQGSSLAANAKGGRVSASDIQELQRFLESKGYSVGSTGVDGLYGPRTHRALEGFLTGRAPDSQGSGAPAPSNNDGGSTGQAGTAPQVTGTQPAATPAAGSTTHAPATTSPAGTGTTRETTGNTGTNASGSRQTAGAPPGYQTIKGQVPAGVTAKAKSLLGGDYGSETPFELDGKRYVARVEHHYHPPGYVGGPNGWHKGVSVYEQKP